MKHLGDGLMVVFERSAIDAVDCATAMHEMAAGFDPDDPVELRRFTRFATGAAGERIADQVESDEFFIFTNGPHEAEVLGDYVSEATASMAAFRNRYGV